LTRLISGIVLAAAALAAILFLPFLALRVLAAIVAALAANEYLTITATDRSGVVGAVVACALVSGGDVGSVGAVAALTFVIAVTLVMTRNSPIQAAATAAFATIYIGMPLGMLAAVQGTFGASATLMMIGTIVVSDSAQYYTGRAFGRHPLAPAISPKKTIEGAIGGVILGTAFVVAAGAYLYGLRPRTAIPFGLVVVALGIIGDLFESRLKRAANVKDSSNLIPGHGGVLDRIDALLFAAPAFYFYFKS
jgi:phosphatidate cytidylyltransferase